MRINKPETTKNENYYDHTLLAILKDDKAFQEGLAEKSSLVNQILEPITTNKSVDFALLTTENITEIRKRLGEAMLSDQTSDYCNALFLSFLRDEEKMKLFDENPDLINFDGQAKYELPLEITPQNIRSALMQYNRLIKAIINAVSKGRKAERKDRKRKKTRDRFAESYNQSNKTNRQHRPNNNNHLAPSVKHKSPISNGNNTTNEHSVTIEIGTQDSGYFHKGPNKKTGAMQYTCQQDGNIYIIHRDDEIKLPPRKSTQVEFEVNRQIGRTIYIVRVMSSE